jgi:NAD-dependent dihydropyrimidine dehydrogenase PreA subunit
MTQMYLKDVTTLVLDIEKCVGCGMCAEVCPHGVFVISKGKARIAERDLCMECGACALNCPANALAVNAGVGCASAIITGWFTGEEISCDCSDDETCC